MKAEKTMSQKLSNNGFTPAISPVAETTIVTDGAQILSGETSIPTQGENMPAFHAKPRTANGPLPVILVIQEIFGVHQHIRDICHRLAMEGYLAVAPELYFRQGDPAEYDDIPTLLKEIVSNVPDAQVLADLDHVANWASRHGGDMRNMAITGFCWGGAYYLAVCSTQPAVKSRGSMVWQACR